MGNAVGIPSNHSAEIGFVALVALKIIESEDDICGLAPTIQCLERHYDRAIVHDAHSDTAGVLNRVDKNFASIG
jgi:hypothetical protein